MFYVPVNSNGHVWTLPPFMGLLPNIRNLGCPDTQNVLHINITTQLICMDGLTKKVQVGKDQEKAQSEKDSHSKNRGGKKPN